jgi:hypothetical protein
MRSFSTKYCNIGTKAYVQVMSDSVLIPVQEVLVPVMRWWVLLNLSREKENHTNYLHLWGEGRCDKRVTPKVVMVNTLISFNMNLKVLRQTMCMRKL